MLRYNIVYLCKENVATNAIGVEFSHPIAKGVVLDAKDIEGALMAFKSQIGGYKVISVTEIAEDGRINY